MLKILEKHRNEIENLCHKYGVACLYVFGSALRDDFSGENSDLDLLVEFSIEDPYKRADAYFELLDELRVLLNVDVDLVVSGAIKNQYIADDIERTKQQFYAA